MSWVGWVLSAVVLIAGVLVGSCLFSYTSNDFYEGQ